MRNVATPTTGKKVESSINGHWFGICLLLLWIAGIAFLVMESKETANISTGQVAESLAQQCSAMFKNIGMWRTMGGHDDLQLAEVETLRAREQGCVN